MHGCNFCSLDQINLFSENYIISIFTNIENLIFGKIALKNLYSSHETHI